MNTYKKGNVITCINDGKTPSANFKITKGNHYQVRFCWGEDVVITDDNGQAKAIRASQFKRADIITTLKFKVKKLFNQ